jgi:hypothetical protein
MTVFIEQDQRHHVDPGRWPVVTTSFPPSLIVRLRRAAQANNLTLADTVREAVRRYTDGLLDEGQLKRENPDAIHTRTNRAA